jgi:hypothetical protein
LIICNLPAGNWRIQEAKRRFQSIVIGGKFYRYPFLFLMARQNSDKVVPCTKETCKRVGCCSRDGPQLYFRKNVRRLEYNQVIKDP